MANNHTEEKVSKTSTRMQMKHLEQTRQAAERIRRRISNVQLDLCSNSILCIVLAVHNQREWFIDNRVNIVKLLEQEMMKIVTMIEYITCLLQTKADSSIG